MSKPTTRKVEVTIDEIVYRPHIVVVEAPVEATDQELRETAENWLLENELTIDTESEFADDYMCTEELTGDEDVDVKI